MSVKHLVISSSLSPNSRSRVLAQRAYERLLQIDEGATWLDTSSLEMPLCDASSVWSHDTTVTLQRHIEDADGILLALGIYNYGAPAVAKTLVELAGSAWNDKVVGFLCAAGGASSYMAVMSFANSLMLDFRSVIVPRFVYASGESFGHDDRLIDPAVEARIDEVVERWTSMTVALRNSPSTADGTHPAPA